jgi:hypothetical protein
MVSLFIRSREYAPLIQEKLSLIALTSPDFRFLAMRWITISLSMLV